MKAIDYPTVGLKAAILMPFALLLIVLIGGALVIFADQELEYNKDYIGTTFLSVPRIFHSAVESDTNTLSTALELITRDEVLRAAMVAKDRDKLLQHASPFYNRLRERYGITHFYFSGPDRVNLLRVHQPDRYGDKITRVTTSKAQATGKPAAGLELGPLGTFTLRVVFPWYDGQRLIGYVELGEEVEHLLQRIKTISGIDLYVTIDKRYLSQKDWTAGMRMLGHEGAWDLLPESVIVFQTTDGLNTPMRDLLSMPSRLGEALTELSVNGRVFQAQTIPLFDVRDLEVGRMLLLQDTTLRAEHSRRDLIFFSGLAIALGGGVFGLFFWVIARVEKRLESSRVDLMASEQRFRTLVESSSDWIWEVDIQGVYTYASPKVYDLLGYKPEEIIGRTPFDLMPPAEAKHVRAVFDKFVAAEQPFYGIENTNLHKNGHLVVLETNGVPIFSPTGALCGFRGMDRDITERKATEMRLRQAATVFENTSEGVIITGPDQCILAVNQAFTRITGYSDAEVKGCKPNLLRSGRHNDDYYRQMWAAINTTGQWQGEIWNRRKDGTDYPEWLNISEVRDEAGAIVNYIGVFADISSIKESQDKLEYTAHHDALTGLPNRLLFRDRLEQALAMARRAGEGVALLFVDLDRFKVINDTLGHESGDVLLQEVAQRLLSCIREEDTVARMGGDEFVIIQKGIRQSDDAASLASRVLLEISRSLCLDGHEIVTNTSIGISLYPQDGGDVSTLLKNADAAMYRAKDRGRNCFQYYSNEITAAELDRLELENDLRRAVERDELLLHYQPQVDLTSGRIIGAEALIRWQHPSRGMISPEVFIPLAEDIGLIGSIGEWVLHTACVQAKTWQMAGLPTLRMAVNASGRQISTGHFVNKVASTLRRSGLAPQFLEIEVTESVVMKDATQAISTLTALKDIGVALAIDDFGTGYCSLSYLKRFPVDKLKIDKSFVDGLPTEIDDAAITKAIVAMSQSLRLKVIAEGVETDAQLSFLRAHGCDEIQGYFFSKPLSAEQFVELLGNAYSFDIPTAV